MRIKNPLAARRARKAQDAADDERWYAAMECYETALENWRAAQEPVILKFDRDLTEEEVDRILNLFEGTATDER